MKHNDVVAKLINADAMQKYALSETGTREMFAKLKGLTGGDLFPGGYQDAEMAACCLAGLWLLYNFLHEGHEICQDIDTPEGSFWHAIMHRAEGDYSNAKYWYRRANLESLHDAISETAGQPYTPHALVDRVETDGAASVHRLITAEWETLFNHCYHHATSAS